MVTVRVVAVRSSAEYATTIWALCHRAIARYQGGVYGRQCGLQADPGEPRSCPRSPQSPELAVRTHPPVPRPVRSPSLSRVSVRPSAVWLTGSRPTAALAGYHCQRLRPSTVPVVPPAEWIPGLSVGRPLARNVRTDMEARFGRTSPQSVYTTTSARTSRLCGSAPTLTRFVRTSCSSVAARPSSRVGRLALAHELTHVVQQRTGPVDGAPAPGGLRISDPSDRFEREAAEKAERVISAAAPASAWATGQPGTDPVGCPWARPGRSSAAETILNAAASTLRTPADAATALARRRFSEPAYPEASRGATRILDRIRRSGGIP